MLDNYNRYLKEDVKNSGYEIECKIDEKYLLEISGQKTVIDAIINELNWTDTINVNIAKKVDGEDHKWKILADVDDRIMEDTDAMDVKEGIFYEFSWLKQSGITIEKVNKLW